MKSKTVFTCGLCLFLTALLCVLCSSRSKAIDTGAKGFKTDPKILREKLVGSWKIVSASFDGKDSELHRTSITIKHITPVHVIWIGYQPEAREIFRSSGGSWTIENGRYVETMRYGIGEKYKETSFGKSYGFDCRFEGDRWIQSGKMPNGVFLEEIWQRVKENEDVATWPEGSRPK